MEYLQVFRGGATQKLAKGGPPPSGLAVFCPAPSLLVASGPIRYAALLAPWIWSQNTASQWHAISETQH